MTKQPESKSIDEQIVGILEQFESDTLYHPAIYAIKALINQAVLEEIESALQLATNTEDGFWIKYFRGRLAELKGVKNEY